MSYERNIGAMLFGMLAGVGIGILIAPDKGSETRRKIAKSGASARDNIYTEAGYLKDSLIGKTQELRDSVSKSFSGNKPSFDEKLIALLAEANYTTEDLIKKLEGHLKTLKAHSQKLHSD